MNKIIYLISGIIFGWGLSLSGMIDPSKVKGFLSLGFSDWNPALLFVLGSAVPVYLVAFLWMKKRQKTLTGSTFASPPMRPIDKKLIIGSAIFGIGWGIAGVCPGPALTHIAFVDWSFVTFLATMFVGFELQRRFT